MKHVGSSQTKIRASERITHQDGKKTCQVGSDDLWGWTGTIKRGFAFDLTGPSSVLSSFVYDSPLRSR